jgi:predicted alpha/beta hydrolase
MNQACGLANTEAACRCDRQLPAVRYLAMTRGTERGAVVAMHKPELEEVERQFAAFTRLTDAAAILRAHPDYRVPEAQRAAILAVLRQEGVLYRPTVQRRRAVLVAGGLGIPQRFYAPFATWLAQRGYLVMTFDLRGMGASRRPEHRHSLRGLDADMLTWARQDFPAAVQALSRMADGDSIIVIGHSLGAHHAVMTDPHTQTRIETLVCVAAGSGYWRDWAAPSRRMAPLMLHVAAPLLTPLLGYFPGKALRMVGDLPGPAMRQWIRWCLHPGFAWGAEPERVQPSLQSARFRIEAFSFTDDDAMTEACTRKLLVEMPNAVSTLMVVKPSDVGLLRIGHTGAFRRESAEALWPMFEQAFLKPVSVDLS